MNKKYLLNIIVIVFISFLGFFHLSYSAVDDPLLLIPKSTIKSPATITSFTPTVGEAGDTVTIIGENLTPISDILFGSILVEDVLNIKPKLDSSTGIVTITVPVPQGVVDGKITVKTEKNGNAVSDINFTTVKNIVLDYSDLKATSVKFSASGSLAKGEYLFYVYDENTYPDGAPVIPVFHSVNSVDGARDITFIISGLTPSRDYVGVIDMGGTGWGTQNAPEAVPFTTLSDSTGMNSITPSVPSKVNTNTPTTDPGFSGLVPKCNVGAIDPATGQYVVPCNFDYFMKLINGLIKFLLFVIATPLVALIIMYTGYLYISAGGSAGQTEKAKHILSNVVIGYIIALAAWLIINTLVTSLLPKNTDINTFLDKSSLTK